MRVLILSTQPPVRGVLRSLATLGIEAIVIRDAQSTEPDSSVQEVHVSARGDRSSPVDLRWSRRGLRTAVRDVRPDVMHIVGDPWTPTAEAGAAAARDLDVPYVLVGTSSRGEPRSLTARWQADRIRRDAAALAGIVRPALEHLGAGGADDARPRAVVPLGGHAIPAHLEARPDPDGVTFALVGRLVPERGAALLLDALSGTYGPWRLVIAGTGPVHEEVEQQAQRLGLSARLQWLGALPREQLEVMWREIDAVVAPSRSTPEWTEPTGNVVIEAMAHGVAPVVTRCGALPDVVGEAGLIVDEDDRAALTRALQGLVSDPGRSRAIGRQARDRVLSEYSDAAVAARMVDLWRRVLPPTPGTAPDQTP